MATFSPVWVWAMTIIASVATAGLIYRVMGLVPRGRLMRCPGTDAMTFVEMGRASRGDGSEPTVTVQGCDFWPAYYECTGRCLARLKRDVWRKWRKWGQLPISEAEAKDTTLRLSLQTWI